MYLRFVTPGRGPERGVAPGLFRSGHAWDCIDVAPDYLREAIEDEYKWFNAHLPIPDCTAVRSKGVWRYVGVCWFKGQHKETIAHAWTLAALLKDAGAQIHLLKTKTPGDIIYKDDMQVVARPREWTPRGYLH